jgi:hypothetical protein
MADVIELKSTERPPAGVRYSLVVSSLKFPRHGAGSVDRGPSRIYYATIADHDVDMIVERAKVWADARQIANVYLRRE